MSIKCTSRVWDYSAASSTELLVLLAISDHAHEDGTGAYPSIRSLAAKCKISRRSVQRYIKKLNERGELKVEYGKGRNGTNMYTVLSGLIPGGQVINRMVCYMCSCVDDDDIVFHEHHRVPGDDTTKIVLCVECHTRLHGLIGTDGGGDNLTPLVPGGDGFGEGGDVSGGSGVTATTPKPSVNRQEPSVQRGSNESKIVWDAFLLAWAQHLPHKVQPRYSNLPLQRKLMIRLRSKYFRENYHSALREVSTSGFIGAANWFQADWFLKNDTNWEKCLDGKYRDNDNNKHSTQQATKNGLVKYLKDEGVIVD